MLKDFLSEIKVPYPRPELQDSSLFTKEIMNGTIPQILSGLPIGDRNPLSRYGAGDVLLDRLPYSKDVVPDNYNDEAILIDMPKLKEIAWLPYHIEESVKYQATPIYSAFISGLRRDERVLPFIANGRILGRDQYGIYVSVCWNLYEPESVNETVTFAYKYTDIDGNVSYYDKTYTATPLKKVAEGEPAPEYPATSSADNLKYNGYTEDSTKDWGIYYIDLSTINDKSKPLRVEKITQNYYEEYEIGARVLTEKTEHRNSVNDNIYADYTYEWKAFSRKKIFIGWKLITRNIKYWNIPEIELYENDIIEHDYDSQELSPIVMTPIHDNFLHIKNTKVFVPNRIPRGEIVTPDTSFLIDPVAGAEVGFELPENYQIYTSSMYPATIIYGYGKMKVTDSNTGLTIINWTDLPDGVVKFTAWMKKRVWVQTTTGYYYLILDEPAFKTGKFVETDFRIQAYSKYDFLGIGKNFNYNFKRNGTPFKITGVINDLVITNTDQDGNETKEYIPPQSIKFIGSDELARVVYKFENDSGSTEYVTMLAAYTNSYTGGNIFKRDYRLYPYIDGDRYIGANIYGSLNGKKDLYGNPIFEYYSLKG